MIEELADRQPADLARHPDDKREGAALPAMKAAFAVDAPLMIDAEGRSKSLIVLLGKARDGRIDVSTIFVRPKPSLEPTMTSDR